MTTIQTYPDKEFQDFENELDELLTDDISPLTYKFLQSGRPTTFGELDQFLGEQAAISRIKVKLAEFDIDSASLEDAEEALLLFSCWACLDIRDFIENLQAR